MLPLPTFRSLTSAAVSLHLQATPLDGAALVLAGLVPALPLTDEALVPHLHGAMASLCGAIAALSMLDYAPARDRLATCHRAQRAYHRAVMAYYGVEVPSVEPGPPAHAEAA